MKKYFILTLLATIILTSCKKEDPQSKERVLTYVVNCTDCILKVSNDLDQVTTHKVTGSLTKTYYVSRGFVSRIEISTERTDLTSYQYYIKVNDKVKSNGAGFILNTNAYGCLDVID